MAEDIYTTIIVNGNKEELTAFIDALKKFRDERIARYEEYRDCGYIENIFVGSNDIDKIEDIAEFVSDKDEINIHISGPYGTYERLSDVGLFEELAKAVPTIQMTGNSSDFTNGGDLMLNVKLIDGALQLDEFCIPDEDLSEDYIESIKDKLPYSKFCSMFKVDKSIFKEEDYNVFIEEAIGYECFPDMNYDTFIEFCEASKISQDKYEKVVEKLEDLGLVDFDMFRDEREGAGYMNSSVTTLYLY